jgi:hypothetical protein
VLRAARALVALTAAVAIAGCGSDASGPVPAGRTLSVSASPRQIPPPTGADFIAAFDLAYSAGARGQLIAATWKQLEPTAGALDVSPLVRQLDYAPGRMPTIYVGIQLINTVAKEVPDDLADTAFDAPAMRERFHALIDALGAALPESITYLSIGNEVSDYLQQTNQWSSPAWQAVVSAARDAGAPRAVSAPRAISARGRASRSCCCLPASPSGGCTHR